MLDYSLRIYVPRAVGNKYPKSSRKPRLRKDSSVGEWIFPACIDGQGFVLGVSSDGHLNHSRKHAKLVSKQVAKGDLAETLKQAAQTISHFEDMLVRQGFGGLKFCLHLPTVNVTSNTWIMSVLESDGRIKRQYAYTHKAESPLAGLRAIDTVRH